MSGARVSRGSGLSRLASRLLPFVTPPWSVVLSVITMWPGPERTGNRYTVLLYRALQNVGLHYADVPMSLRAVLRQGPSRPFHYVHFHWPEVFFSLRPRAPHRLFGFKGYFHLLVLWFALKLRGYRIVWTVHEVDVHDTAEFLWAHDLSRRLLWRLSDLVFTHAASVRTAAERRWGQRRHLYVLPHGNYADAYPDTVRREEARQRLGIPEQARVFVFFGNIRPYKGVEALLRAFQALQVQYPPAHLIVAGRPHSEEYGQEIASASHGIANVHLVLDFIPDEEVQVYLRAADCLVAPYVHLETCGAVYLALTFDLPVIVTRAGSAMDLELLDVGVLIDRVEETEAALQHMLELSPVEWKALRQRVRSAAQRHSWAELGPRYRMAFDLFEAEQQGRESGEARRGEDRSMSRKPGVP